MTDISEIQRDTTLVVHKNSGQFILDLDSRFEVRTIPTRYATCQPSGEYAKLYQAFLAKDAMFGLGDVAIEAIYPLFSVDAVNLYDTAEPGTPRIRFLNSKIGKTNAGIPPKGKPVVEFGNGDAYSREMARSIDTVAACRTPLFQHVMTWWNGHAYYRLLLPVADDSGCVIRVLGAFVYPRKFLDDLL